VRVCLQKKGHFSAPASEGEADVDDAKAATTGRTIAKDKRIVCKGAICDTNNMEGQ
jgi:protocatechuate 3,4-dioxygenase beta subunit